ncbi:MAG: SpoIID/LytB domain-containing protein [Elusimicrobia bacterium]|nr:SpoIID/LytB domain-containing protein [Elusimicrobiota bacterium]
MLQEQGRNSEAVGLLDGCVRRAIADPELRSALAWAYYHEGALPKARTNFEEAIKIGSRRPLDLLGAAQTALEEKNYDQAQALLAEVAEKQPRLALAYYYQGKAYEAQEKPDEAIAAYQRVLKEDSHFVEARPFLAALFERMKRVDEAWKQYARIFQVDPKHVLAREKKGSLLAALTKQPDEIIPPKIISKHTPVERAPGWEKDSIIRVGIGTSAGGNVLPRKAVAFRAAGAFVLADSVTGKELAKGEGREIWIIRVEPKNRYAAEIVDPKGKVAATFKKSVRLKMAISQGRTTILSRLSYAPSYAWGGVADRELRGEIEIALSPTEQSLVIINLVNLEEYLYGVLNSEMPTNWPMEALKAQAVLARTQAVYRRKISRPHKALGYDVCDEQHCQVYGGVAVETKRAKTAVDETRAQFLTHKGSPAHSIFFSNCGGHTQSGREIGWGNVAYWQGVFDGKDATLEPQTPAQLKRWLQSEPAVYCNLPKYAGAAEFRWTRVVLASDLEARVSRKRNLGRIKNVIPLRRSRAGHMNAIRIQGTAGDLVVDREHETRRVLGLGALRSTLFVIETTYRDGKAYAFTLYGGGWGHGVGMCQAGAGGQAEAGASYKDILTHYYPGTALRPEAN